MTQRARTRDLIDELNRHSWAPMPPCPPCPPPDIPTGHTGRLVFDTYDQFPEEGNIRTLYFDQSMGALYYWTEDDGYIIISSGGSIERTHIDGGGAENV